MFVGKNNISGIGIVLGKLEESDFAFYSTGSRFLETNRQDSDYDFFVTGSPEVLDFLESLGFVSLGETSYPESDPQQELIKILRHAEFPIDVQLVVDAKRKNDIQNAISSYLLPRGLSKEMTKILWRVAYAAFYANNERSNNRHGSTPR